MTSASATVRFFAIVVQFVGVIRTRLDSTSTRALGRLRSSLRARGAIAKPDQSGLASELERLAVMHSRGQLTWSEFGNARAQLLGQG